MTDTEGGLLETVPTEPDCPRPVWRDAVMSALQLVVVAAVVLFIVVVLAVVARWAASVTGVWPLT